MSRLQPEQLSPTLEEVSASYSALGDESLRVLADLPALAVLDLEETPVTDAGLMHLGACKSLTYLNVVGTSVSDAAVARLGEALPELEIAH